MAVSKGLSLDLLVRDAPVREKVAMMVERHPGRDELSIYLALPLRPEVPAEQALQEATGQSVLRVGYAVAGLDLGASRTELARLVREAYARPGLGDRLREPGSIASLSAGELRTILLALAVHGDNIRRRLFGFPDALVIETGRPRMHDAAIRAVLREAFVQPRILHIKSDIPLFPWGFLYQHITPLDSMRPATFAATGFWGFRHEIQHDVPGVATALVLPRVPRILAAVCPNLRDTGHHDPLHPLRLADTQFVDDVLALRRALTDFTADCLYFCGHAHHDPEPLQSTSTVSLGGVSLSVATLEQIDGPQFQQEPVLLFLNGCGTGDLQRWDDNSFAGYIVHRGDNRICCITTATAVPDGFAVAFARLFWAGFLGEGKPLGAALLAARCELLARHNNPLGLLYEVIGQIDTHVRPALETTTR